MAIRNPLTSIKYYTPPIIGSIKRRLQWNITYGTDTVIINDNMGTVLTLTKEYYNTLKYELSLWYKQYLPYPLKGLNILDIGSGCGETNYFFNLYSINQLIAIEKNKLSHEIHKINCRVNEWNTRPINEEFNLNHLTEFDFDLAKIDIEGGENILLNLDEIDFDLIAETHSKDITLKLLEKFPELNIKSSHPIYEQYIVSNCG